MSTIEPVYTSEVIKASGLLTDTMVLIANWNDRLSVEENLLRARQDNILGKASRSRTEDVITVFRHRYLRDCSRFGVLRAMVSGGVTMETLRSVMYFFCAQTDRLIHDAVTDIVYPMMIRGDSEVTTEDVVGRLSEWVQQGKTAGKWSYATARRVAEGLLTTLRDFGILWGTRRKVIRSAGLSISAFALVAFDLHRNGLSGARLVSDPEWRLFLLEPADVEKLFLQAHQERLLGYYSAGQIVRVDFPPNTFVEYAYVITQRESCSSRI